MTISAGNLDARQLARLVAAVTITHDGGSAVLGRPDLGVYAAVPEPGAVFVRTLQAGHGMRAAIERASQCAGEPVDGADFLVSLDEVGLLTDGGPESASVAGRPGRQVRWIEVVNPRAARLLFGRTAWSGYATAAAAAVAMLVLVPGVRPTWEDAWFLDDPLLCVLAYLPTSLALAALHEMWHWLAGRAAGVPAVFRVSYRGIFLVFETDLSQLVARPRRRRYGPFLAGMAFDVAVLALALTGRLLYQRGLLLPPAIVYRYLGAVVLGQSIALTWQFGALFMRSDMYAVLANALGCHNLYRTTWLTMKGRLLRLREPDRRELAAAGDRDRSVAKWFSVLYLAGLVAMAWVATTYLLPTAISLLLWISFSLRGAAVGTRPFWESLGMLVYLLLLYGMPIVLAVRERGLRRRGRLL